MAETITCRLINGSSCPLSEQMSNNLCKRQTDTSAIAVDVCMCVSECGMAFGAIERRKTIHSLEYATHFNDDGNRPGIIPLFNERRTTSYMNTHAIY